VERERERERTNQRILRFHLFIRGPLFLSRLFIRGSTLRSTSLYPQFSSSPRSYHAFFFPSFHLLRRTFWRGATKDRPTDRPTDRPSDQTAPASRTVENIALARPIFNYYARSERFSFVERGSGGNLDRSINLTDSHKCRTGVVVHPP